MTFSIAGTCTRSGQVGCAVATCSDAAAPQWAQATKTKTPEDPFPGWDGWVMWVCHYEVRGNRVGHRPYVAAVTR